MLTPEQFSIGGMDTVRGYRQNQIVADNGILGSVEVRFPLTSNPDILQVAPFFDIGKVWNNQNSDPDITTIASLGLGVRWLIQPDLSLRLDYGIPLTKIENQGNSLQDNGLYFHYAISRFSMTFLVWLKRDLNTRPWAYESQEEALFINTYRL